MKATSRKFGGPTKGVNEMKQDAKESPVDSDVDEKKEAAFAKGKTKKRVGGPVGAAARAHGGRAARKSGGSCEDSPFSSARSGTAAKGRKLEKETMD